MERGVHNREKNQKSKANRKNKIDSRFMNVGRARRGELLQ